MLISDWSSDVCSSDLAVDRAWIEEEITDGRRRSGYVAHADCRYCRGACIEQQCRPCRSPRSDHARSWRARGTGFASCRAGRGAKTGGLDSLVGKARLHHLPCGRQKAEEYSASFEERKRGG